MPSQPGLFDRVCDLIVDIFGFDKGNIAPNTRFIEDLNMDSLDAVEFAMELEDIFEISIPDEDIHRLHTVGELTEYLERKGVELTKPA